MTQDPLAALIDRVNLTPAALDTSGSPVLSGDEQIVAQFADVSLIVGSSLELGAGTLYTTGQRVIWASAVRKAVSVTFRQISMHAISRDVALHAKPCIYCQLDEPEDLAISGDGDEDLDSYELKFVPPDEQQVEALFKAFCDGAENNPDDFDEDEGEFFFDKDEVLAGLDEAGLSRLQGLEDRLQLPTAQEFDELVAGDPERFQDGEETEAQMPQ